MAEPHRSARLQRAARHRSEPRTWDAPVTRLETGAGYYIRRNLLAKGTYQHNWRDGGPVTQPRAVRGAAAFLAVSVTLVLPSALCSRLCCPLRQRSLLCASALRKRRSASSAAGSTCDARPHRSSGGRTSTTSACTPRHDAPDLRRSVVYLESAPALAFPDVEPQRATMDQRNETFVPHVLAITVGTTVDFPNSDHTYHNVFSLQRPTPLRSRPLCRRPLEIGPLRSPRHRPRVLRNPLAHERVHPRLQPPVLRRHRRPTAGTRSAACPPGRYTLVAWNEGAIRESRPIVIPDDGGAVEADFALR